MIVLEVVATSSAENQKTRNSETALVLTLFAYLLEEFHKTPFNFVRLVFILNISIIANRELQKID